MAPDTIPNAPTSGARTGGHDAGYHSVRVHGSLNVTPDMNGTFRMKSRAVNAAVSASDLRGVRAISPEDPFLKNLDGPHLGFVGLTVGQQ